MPRLRGGVPVGRAVRAPHGVGARAARRASGAGRVARRREALRRVAEWVAYVVVLPRHTVLRRAHVAPLGGAAAPPRAAAVRHPTPPSARRSGRRLDARRRRPDAFLFTGCVMDAWQRDVHRDAHAGDARDRRPRRARRSRQRTAAARSTCTPAASTRRDDSRGRVIRAFPGDDAVVVDSAGCGAAMKDYGRLLGTPEARGVRRAGARLLRVGRRQPTRAPVSARPAQAVVVQDPCHLRHVQHAHQAVRDGARARVRLRRHRRRRPVLRCRRRVRGAAARARRRDPRSQGRGASEPPRRRATQSLVASANPGCAMHLARRRASTCATPPSCSPPRSPDHERTRRMRR